MLVGSALNSRTHTAECCAKSLKGVCFDCNLPIEVRSAAMSRFGQRSSPWPGHPTLTQSEPAAAVAAAAEARGEESRLRDFGTSMDAISFGFAATAILISIFLLMAIFEHLIKPRAFPVDGSPGGAYHPARRRHGHSPGKLRSPPTVESMLQADDLSVLMPGQRYPTFLAQPAPLPPSCPREGVDWPAHDHPRSYMPP